MVFIRSVLVQAARWHTMLSTQFIASVIQEALNECRQPT